MGERRRRRFRSCGSSPPFAIGSRGVRLRASASAPRCSLVASWPAARAAHSRPDPRRAEGQVRAADLRAQSCRQSADRRQGRARQAPVRGPASCRRPAPSPAPPATTPSSPSPTASPPARASPASPSCATRRRCGTWPGARCCSGTAAPRASRTRSAFPSSTPTRWAPPSRMRVARLSRHDSYVQRLRASLPAGPADLAGQHRQGARRLRAHAGVAADALRPMGRRRCGGAVALRGQRLCASSPARAAASTATPALPSPTTASTTSACRARTRAAAPIVGLPAADPRLQGADLARARLDRALHARRLARHARRRGAHLRDGRHRPPDAQPRTCRDIISLTDQERADLVAFLETLSSETPPQPSTEPWVERRRRPAPLPPPRDTTVVSQSNKLFSPQHVRLAAGRTLTVLNDDTRTHNVRIYDPRFDFNSGAQEPHETVTIRFPGPGTFEAFCGIHPSMRLTVEVK